MVGLGNCCFVFFGVITKNDKRSSTVINPPNQTSNFIGSGYCIKAIRNNFSSTKKTISNEYYEGDGIFKITALDPHRGITFNAFISTDWNCSINNENISDID
jgi:hypothetical protein